MSETVVTRNRLTSAIVATAAILGGLGVVIGAFGAHGLETSLADSGLAPDVVAKRLDQFDVGARYHLVHAVALLALAGLPAISRSARMAAFGLMVAGIVLFSGSLYLLVVTNTPKLGAITPIGGVCWIIAWSIVAVSATRNRSQL